MLRAWWATAKVFAGHMPLVGCMLHMPVTEYYVLACFRVANTAGTAHFYPSTASILGSCHNVSLPGPNVEVT